MTAVAPRSTFGYLLEEFRQHVGLSQSQLAHAIHVDPSYVNRLVRGERPPPSRDILDAMLDELNLTLLQRNRMLVAAGHAPIGVEWEPTLQAVADVLDDQHLDMKQREIFRSAVMCMAETLRGRGR